METTRRQAGQLSYQNIERKQYRVHYDISVFDGEFVRSSTETMNFKAFSFEDAQQNVGFKITNRHILAAAAFVKAFNVTKIVNIETGEERNYTPSKQALELN